MRVVKAAASRDNHFILMKMGTRLTPFCSESLRLGSRPHLIRVTIRFSPVHFRLRSMQYYLHGEGEDACWNRVFEIRLREVGSDVPALPIPYADMLSHIVITQMKVGLDLLVCNYVLSILVTII